MKKRDSIVEIENTSKGYLALPFDEKQFQDFIKGLLGKPQTITKRIRGNFEIHLKDLQNFHDLLNQRITQQNHGKLIQLRTKIYYSDDSSVMLSSYEELLTYNEVKPIISDAVKMTWIYLIQFADKNVPEKQEIELMIISSPFKNVVEDDDIPIIIPSRGEFRLSIQHTARTWGSDIESLLTNQIHSMLIKCSGLREFISKRSSDLGLIIGVLFLISSLIGIYFNTGRFNQNEVKVVNQTLHTIGDNASKKIDYLIGYIANNSQNFFFLKSLLFIVISILFAIILGFWIELLANNKVKSYVVLTREAVKNRDKDKKRRERKTVWFVISILVSIITGVIGNFIFTWFTKQ